MVGGRAPQRLPRRSSTGAPLSGVPGAPRLGSSRGLCRLPLRALLLAAVLLLPAAGIFAEHRSTVELELYNTAARGADGTWTGMGMGQATLAFEQTGNRSVRSDFEISAIVTPTPAGTPDAVLGIGTAYAKFRFADMRAVAGKAPFSWGEGLVFNVADAMFSRGTGTNLMQSEFEDASAWLTGLSWYFGPFSFVEVLALPAPLEAVTDESDGETVIGYAPPALEDVRGGLRAVTKILGIKAEGGYLYDGRDATAGASAFRDGAYYHRPYLSLQGNLGVDWHLSGSLEIPDRGGFVENLEEGILLNAGIYSLTPAA